MSLRQTGKIIEGEFGDECSGISPQTISHWATFYAKAASTAVRGVKATTGVGWVAFIIFFEYGQRWWFVKDEETGYILSSQVGKNDTEKCARSVIERALASANRPCESLTYKFIEDSRYWGSVAMHGESVVSGLREAVRDCAPGCAIGAPDSATLDYDKGMFVELVKEVSQRYRRSRKLDVLETYLNGWTISYNLFADTLVSSERTPGQIARAQVPFGSWEDIVRQAHK